MQCLAHAADQDHTVRQSQPNPPRPDPLDEEKHCNADGEPQAGGQKRRKHRTDRFDHETAETENKCLQDQIEITHVFIPI